MSHYEQNISRETPQDITREMVGRDSEKLYDVADKFGTAGLYVRTEATLDEHELLDSTDVRWAMSVGFALHSADVRTNGRYNDHLMIVGLQVIENFNVANPDIIAAAFLHDAIEDHPKDLAFMLTGEDISEVDDATAREIAYVALREKLPRVADIVLDVSNPIIPKDEEGNYVEDKLVAYTRHTTELLEDPTKGKSGLLKLSDFMHNAVNNHLTIGEKRKKLDKKYIMQYDAYLRYVYSPHSEVPEESRQDIYYALIDGLERATLRREKDELEDKRDRWRSRIASAAMSPKRLLKRVSKIGSKGTDSSPRDDTEPQHL
mgnify:CR=1 FL=1